VSKKSSPNPSDQKAPASRDKAFVSQDMTSAERDPEEWSLIAIESAPYGVIVHDAQGKILIFNSQLEALSGYGKDEIPDIATWIRKIYPDSDYRKIVLEQRNTELQENHRRVRGAIITRKDGVLLHANQQFFDMFGYQAREVLGRQAIPIMIAPESVPYIQKQMRVGTLAPYEVMGLKKRRHDFSCFNSCQDHGIPGKRSPGCCH
jgi:PAS domain S-box-containing protein